MINTKYVREHLEEIKESLKKRRSNYPIADIETLDAKWRQLRASLQEMQSKRNKDSIEVSKLKKEGKDTKKLLSALAKLKDEITNAEAEIGNYEAKINSLLMGLPNKLHPSVPVGNPPESNKILKTWGTVKKKKGENHEAILTKLGMLDIERAGKTAGARFYYLKGDLVLLEQSLLRFALDELSKKGYIPVLPPFMLRRKFYEGVAPLSVFEDALYSATSAKNVSLPSDYEKVEDDLFMISTSEHALAAMHSNEILLAKDLPLKYTGISPCFRREAGAHGKDTKGIFRVHQFDKVEQFILCRQEDDDKYFEELLKNSEELMQKLGIPYRAVLLCSGDTGHQMSRTVDIEGYFPSQEGYRELTSCSSAAEWQSIRLDIRYDEGSERKFAYTLNSTAIAAERMLVAIVENYSNADGTITIPDVLVPYMGGKRKIG